MGSLGEDAAGRDDAADFRRAERGRGSLFACHPASRAYSSRTTSLAKKASMRYLHLSSRRPGGADGREVDGITVPPPRARFNIAIPCSRARVPSAMLRRFTFDLFSCNSPVR
eukprot:scaffold173516_cov27-Tisochrysis_lutea.AAC.7